MSNSTLTSELQNLVAAIRKYPDPRKAAVEWKRVYDILRKTGLSADRVSGVVGMRDIAELEAIIRELQEPQAQPDVAAPDEETCREAFKAFRKRYSLTLLDEESKLGRNPLTKGAESSIAGIVPPKEWPESVWQELVKRGLLRYVGYGLYALPR